MDNGILKMTASVQMCASSYCLW